LGFFSSSMSQLALSDQSWRFMKEKKKPFYSIMNLKYQILELVHPLIIVITSG
jgi:hypothetical protein